MMKAKPLHRGGLCVQVKTLRTLSAVSHIGPSVSGV